tara:strand:- start:456 stop:626 length:171 start_codon:yes stop_codon:yes gene_type:complete
VPQEEEGESSDARESSSRVEQTGNFLGRSFLIYVDLLRLRRGRPALEKKDCFISAS